MIDFLPIASGSGGNCYLVRDGSAPPLLIECGVRYTDLRRALHAQGVMLANLAGCVISHAHGDHAKALHDFLDRCVPCYMSPDAAAHWNELAARDAGRIDEFRPLSEGGYSPVTLCGWRVQPFHVVHDSPGTVGFVIDSPGGERLLYATDTRYVPYTVAGLSFVAIECNHSFELLRRNVRSGAIAGVQAARTARNHMALERVIKCLKANDLSKVRQIILLHLSNDNSDADAFRAAVERATGVPTLVAPAKEGQHESPTTKPEASGRD